MKVSNFKIKSTDLDQFVNYLIKKLSFDYENHSADMSVLASEEYYFRNNSTQLNMLIVKLEDAYISVDIMGSAGGSGLLNINLGSEKGYIKKARKVIEGYVIEHNLETDQVIERSMYD
jgi:hypothetical protein